MIVRQPKQSNFTMLSNIPVIDLNLSAVSLGLYVYIISKPDNWKAHKNEILKRFENASIKTTKNMIDAAFSELIAAGYIKIITPRTKNAQGKTVFLGKQYHFFETPNEAAQFSESEHLRESEMSDIGRCPTSQDVRRSEILPHLTKTDLLASTDINLISTEKEEKEFVEQSPTLFPEKNSSTENGFEETIEDKNPTIKTKCEIPAEQAKYFFEVSQILKEFEKLMQVKFKIPETKKLFERYGQANKIVKVLQAGHSLEDCLSVVKLKHAEWFNDSKMRAYIVPDTIFAPNNFGKYLTQLQISKSNPQFGKPTAQTIPISEQAQRDELTLLKTKCHNKRIDFTHITGSISEQIIQIKKLL